MAKNDAGYMPGGGGGASGRGPLGVSTRGTQTDSGTRRMVNQQNKAADSYKIKDLDKMEANKVKYQQDKQRRADQLEDSYKAGKLEGKVKAAVVAVPAVVAAEEIGRAVGKKQGSQKDHAITDSKNYTKPVIPAQKQGEAKRPAVGNDKAVAKKVKGPSHNNGYTN